MRRPPLLVQSPCVHRHILPPQGQLIYQQLAQVGRQAPCRSYIEVLAEILPHPPPISRTQNEIGNGARRRVRHCGLLSTDPRHRSLLHGRYGRSPGHPRVLHGKIIQVFLRPGLHSDRQQHRYQSARHHDDDTIRENSLQHRRAEAGAPHHTNPHSLWHTLSPCL